MHKVWSVVVALAATSLSAQSVRDIVPLNNWPAPLHWQPSRVEAENGARSVILRGSSGEMIPHAATPAAGGNTATGSLMFVAMTPCRVVDTRVGTGLSGAFGPPSLAGGATRNFPILSNPTCSIPSIAEAHSFNVAVVPPGPLGFLTIWQGPISNPRPLASTLNDLTGTVVANAAIIPAGMDGSVNVFASSNTNPVIDINGYFASPSDLNSNTAVGGGALQNNTTGNGNTASGYLALFNNTTGNGNTASGYNALQSNTTGFNNTASGASALTLNTTGTGNTASGYFALFANSTGDGNTASGSFALRSNTTGSGDTASGASALQNNTTGDGNTASGYAALQNNTTGNGNAASGLNALTSNTIGYLDTASGAFALQANTTGSENTASGDSALGSNSTGAATSPSGTKRCISAPLRTATRPLALGL